MREERASADAGAETARDLFVRRLSWQAPALRAVRHVGARVRYAAARLAAR